MNVNVELLLRASVTLVAIGIMIQSLELLCNRRHLGFAAVLGWPDFETRKVSVVHRLFYNGRGTLVLLITRAVAALLTPFCRLESGIGWVFLTALFALQLWYNSRFSIIAANSDTMSLIVVAGIWVAAMPGASPWIIKAAFCFIAIQVMIAYSTAGWSKARAAVWRDGRRLGQVLRDSSYEPSRVVMGLVHQRGFISGAARGVIALQLFFPVAVFCPTPVFAGFMVGGVIFHLLVAFLMGLHGFLWSFSATYPALWFIHHEIHRAFATLPANSLSG